MPSFAELKQKASKATDSSISAVRNTKDRHTSVPMKNTEWNPYNHEPPPPPKPSAWAKPAKPEAPLAPPPVRRATSSSSLNTTNSSTRLAPGASFPKPKLRPGDTPSPPPTPTPATRPTPPGRPPVTNRASQPPPPVSARGVPPPPSPRPSLPNRVSSSNSGSCPPVINRSTRPGQTPPLPPSRAPSLPIRAPSSAPLPNRTPVPSVPSRVPSHQQNESKREETEIDWTNLSLKDKEVFFSWLDEFFERIAH